MTTRKNIYFIIPNFKTNHLIIGVGETEQDLVNGRLSMSDHAKARSWLAAFSPDGEGDYEILAFFKDFKGRDHDIHKFIITIPHSRKHCEVFAFRGNHSYSAQSILDMCVKKFNLGKDYNQEKVSFVPRQYQKEFVAKAQAEYLEFLLFAKCRAGKSAMTYLHILDKGFKLSLVCSYRLSPSDSWFKDPQKFSQFENIRFINMNSKTWESELKFYLEQPEIQIVLWSTVQGLQSRVSKIKEISTVDFLVLDESHVGNKASQFNNVRNQLITTPCLNISGTAYKQIWDYSEDKSFVYSYFEEQLDNFKGIYTPLRPKMIVKVVKYFSKEYQKIYGNDPDAMKNIFVLNDEKDAFMYPELVRDFIHKYFAPQLHIKDRKDRLLYGAQHLLMCLPSVGACHLFAEMIESYFLPLVVTADTKRTSEDIEKFIQENKEAKTITLTYEANVLGVTQEHWDTIINCKEGKAKEFWTQFAFRGGSGDNDWVVIDFCPQRCLESLTQYYVTSCERNPELRSRELVEFIAIFEFENGHKQLNQDDIYSILAADATSSTRLISGILDGIDLTKFAKMKMNLKLNPSKRFTKKDVVNDNKGNGKSNEIFSSESEENPPISDKELLEKKNTLLAITDSIPLVIFYELKDENAVNSIQSVMDSDYYAKITQDTEGYLEEALKIDLVNPERLMYRLVDAVSTISKSMINDETMTLFELSTTKNENRSIPVEFLDEIFMV
jgi:hypothetical protein